MDLLKNMMISTAGMKVQNVRMRIIAENLANQDSVATAPGEDPYRRKSLSFQNVLDRETGLNTVQVKEVLYDQSEFGMRYDPGHPAADDTGYIKTTNVNGLVELMDMKQAQRTYESNLNAMDVSKNIVMRTVDLLR
ncbi:flagellar basal body rod protein FlgC [Pseudemcibacter aquimaris]|uniref:flagellar basal body rod protein FlgC n=1 Tax=Pseudemcibacter aquimaris TaxID=2857064 RepID=UPI002011DD4D|nr:flagellar basal body rod protein FlgC [Pseudemcibacter aquimaris]MCC3860826.1 flagellar basal body rod protein FlgC [Pseudemcibacter aquimaris]WDU59645.1 flagellar basal body rod protein FlgC [Pseudemcibacter aquimaris]